MRDKIVEKLIVIKKEDLEISSYLNSVYFGHGAYGVNAAAKAYFNKDQKDLTVREAAVVISLTNNRVDRMYEDRYGYL